MTIGGTKATFSLFQFLHIHFWNNSAETLIAAVRTSNLKMLELWKSVTSTAGRKQPLRVVSRKQLILNCKNVKTDNLKTLERNRLGIFKKFQNYSVESQIG